MSLNINIPMEKNTKSIQKSTYCTPQIELIKLDNEISLQLQSEPPVAPGEGSLRAPEYLNSDPFKLMNT